MSKEDAAAARELDAASQALTTKVGDLVLQELRDGLHPAAGMLALAKITASFLTVAHEPNISSDELCRVFDKMLRGFMIEMAREQEAASVLH